MAIKRARTVPVWLGSELTDLLVDIRLSVELPRDRSTCHGPHQTEDGAVEPGPVVLANDRPCNAGIAARVAAVQFVTIVQKDCPVECSGRVRRPLENLFRPVHAQVVVHPAGRNHLLLSCVPKLVVGLAALQLLEAVAVRAWVAGVFDQCLAGPRCGALPVVVVWLVAHEEHCKLTPADELLKISIAGRDRSFALGYSL